MIKGAHYLWLFPGLAVFSFNLLLLGGVEFPLKFELFGHQIHELESLTVSGGKSLANLAEVYLALMIGLIACCLNRIQWPKKLTAKGWRLIGSSYLVVFVAYLLIPALPE